jgi:serine phosphatase RsbU (regulator of sigma subunit)
VTVGAATRARGETLAELAQALASGLPQAQALEWAARAAVATAGAEAVVVRVLEDDRLAARAVAAGSESLVAELHGSRIPADGLPLEPESDLDALPAGIRSAADRAGADAVFVVPIRQGGTVAGSVELFRRGGAFDAEERLAARLAADHVALALRLHSRGSPDGATDPLEIAGDALVAAADEDRLAERIARLAAHASGAESAWLWRAKADGLELLAGDGAGRPPAPRTAVEIVADPRVHAVEDVGRRMVATLQLGEPPLGALQLRFPPGHGPSDELLARLDRFAVRAAHALRAGERAREASSELQRSRALLEVLGQAISELSLAHTLEIAVERVIDLLGTERVAVHLIEGGRLVPGTPGSVAGPHDAVAERLLDLALGPERGRGLLSIADAQAERVLTAGLEPEVAESGIGAAVALPLVVAGQVTGLLAAYPPVGRVPNESEAALLVALAAQLAVAVENARLHEQAKTLGAELEQALTSERESSRRLGALYEISRAFAQSLSLETTLDAVVKMVAETLGVDAAGIRLPDPRGAELHLRALHVREPRLAEVARTVLSRPQPLTSASLRRVLRAREPLVLRPGQVAEHGGAYALLAPFLEKGSTAAVLPIATPTDVLGTLTILSFEADRPIDSATVDAALSIAGQAALALDNARLYQQQKEFADTMQRSLLPQSAPALSGLDLGAVYDSAATVDVGGDVYDFLMLGDGRLAVVLGDVTGHGVEATADMAMAKYVFRSLAREHDDPADFLALANDVVAGEIAPGKFITMVELVVDAERNLLTCASAGHPAPRLVQQDGHVETVPVGGLALGIEADQTYEAVELAFPPGSVLVVYTDGVIEARRDGELFGVERLDRVLTAERERPAGAIAAAVVAACRRFAGGELTDDCAVVVIARR